MNILQYALMKKEAEEESNEKFDPSYLQMLAPTKAYENAGRARAVLNANDEEAPYSLTNPLTSQLLVSTLGALTGAGIGAGVGYYGYDKYDDDDERNKLGGFGALVGGAIGGLAGGVLALANQIRQSKQVKERISSKDLKTKLAPKKFKEMEHANTVADRNALGNALLGLVKPGSYDAGYADQLAQMMGTGNSGRSVSGYANDILTKGVQAASVAAPLSLGANASQAASFAGGPVPGLIAAGLTKPLDVMNQMQAQNALRAMLKHRALSD